MAGDACSERKAISVGAEEGLPVRGLACDASECALQFEGGSIAKIIVAT